MMAERMILLIVLSIFFLLYAKIAYGWVHWNIIERIVATYLINLAISGPRKFCDFNTSMSQLRATNKRLNFNRLLAVP